MLDSYFGHLEEISKLNDVVTGVTTGFPELDKRTAGLQPSDLIIVAARPSMGKTAFSLNLALNAAAAGKKVAFFSLEMSAEQLESRLISICSKVSLSIFLMMTGAACTMPRRSSTAISSLTIRRLCGPSIFAPRPGA